MRNACLLILISVLFMADPLFAANLSYASTCSIGNLVVTGGSSCSLTDPSGAMNYAAASTSLEYSVLNDDLVLTGSATSIASQLGAGPGYFPTVNAGSTANLQVGIYIPGTGTGYILETMTGMNASSLEGGSAGVNISSSEGGSGYCGGPSFGTSAICNLTSIPGNPAIIVPITLGTVDTFTVNLGTGDTAVFLNGVSHSSMYFTEQFVFVGADGATPIAIMEAPEPTEFGFVAGGVVAGLFVYKKRKNGNPT